MDDIRTMIPNGTFITDLYVRCAKYYAPGYSNALSAVHLAFEDAQKTTVLKNTPFDH